MIRKLAWHRSRSICFGRHLILPRVTILFWFSSGTKRGWIATTKVMVARKLILIDLTANLHIHFCYVHFRAWWRFGICDWQWWSRSAGVRFYLPFHNYAGPSGMPRQSAGHSSCCLSLPRRGLDGGGMAGSEDSSVGFWLQTRHPLLYQNLKLHLHPAFLSDTPPPSPPRACNAPSFLNATECA